MDNIIAYDEFRNLLNKRLFDGSRVALILRVAMCPDRFIGLFRPTKPTTKLIQNLTQSHEIKFGDALEEIFTKYFKKLGFELLSKRITNTTNGNVLNVDQLFVGDDTIYMIEQKVRDDHDSTKKRGQFQNFENKYFEVQKNYPNKTVVPIMWFIDDSLVKNKNYYLSEIHRMNNDYECNAKLCYGEELFSRSIINNLSDLIWNETLSHLKEWKRELPDMPELNFDNDASVVFEEIKDIPPSVFRRLFANEEIKTQILPIIFPNGTTLHMLSEYLDSKIQPVYKKLSRQINDYLLAKNLNV